MWKYNWENIKKFLIPELKKTNHIMTFGTIGSCNVEHDIDIIITKKPDSPSSEFYKEIHRLFNSLNDFLKKHYDQKIVRFSNFPHQQEVLKIGEYKKGDLALHTMIYISYSQIEDDWKPDLTQDIKINDILKKEYKTIFGDQKGIFSKKFQKKGNFDNLFSFIYKLDRINSNYPEDFLVNVMNKLFHYILKYANQKEKLIATTKKEAEECFYKICEILDRLNKNQKSIKT